MWPFWAGEKQRIASALQAHARTVHPLPGIDDPLALDTLALQFVASLRREAYYKLVQQKPISARRADPNDPTFDAERAVAYHLQQGDLEEAAWLIFLMTHFGRPAGSGWRRLQDVYGQLGTGIWNWQTVSSNPAAFTTWLAANWKNIRGKFGNHRKRESLRPDVRRSTARVVDSYVAWVMARGGHHRVFADAVHRGGNHPHAIFDVLYHNLEVFTFGRLGKFDYLSMIGRYGIAPIEAGSAYLDGSTGPKEGARLLFDGRRDGASSTEQLQTMLDALDANLRVGMRVMEDAICNWQKSPMQFVHFKG